MSVFVLIGVDPYSSHIVDFIRKFENREEIYSYVENYIRNDLLSCKESIYRGVRCNIEIEIDKYMDYFRQNRKIRYYGLYKNQEDISEPFEYSWFLYEL